MAEGGLLICIMRRRWRIGAIGMPTLASVSSRGGVMSAGGDLLKRCARLEREVSVSRPSLASAAEDHQLELEQRHQQLNSSAEGAARA